ncbi:branched-chain amino acid ABC transporter permease [Tissierella pigra]|uniref:Branched-chain amino acid ABC transporter permease n=1 Tax=Tissierella pigra TaxID=2607614 RepID=A0A6N7XUK7_9FIRM|nr:branched-chain amino acid ABC transporter permease [Tissierella pigra]MBU5427890.1 branched-chain amino acid ABC transporter permease [Tissierella pigra]MSU00214.1 branched-chain amino acid ABC transporter permease [Tissierella pigra]
MKKNTVFNIILIALVLGILILMNVFLDNYKVTVINLCGIYIILALSMNLINGFTGLFSLGHAGFMAIGAYTVAILTMPVATKEMNFYMKPMVPFLLNLNMPFIFALISGGLMAALFGFLIGAPVLKLTDDYLAIATLGFSEIIRIVIVNLQSITNGSLGLKGIPKLTINNKPNLLWSWGIAILIIVFMNVLMKGSYGKAFKAIREDEIAARSMGINLFKHKVLSFTIGSFLAGIGGGLLATSLGTIDPTQFKFALTFNILLMVVLGGMGNINGNVVSAIVITIAMEALRFLDEPINLGFTVTSALPGLRMVVFSLILMLVVIFKKDGFVKNTLEKVRGKYAKN